MWRCRSSRRDNHDDAAAKLEYLARELRQRHIALMQDLVDEQDDILGSKQPPESA
jgi:hypothetical protein